MCLTADDPQQTLDAVHEMLAELAEDSEPIDRDLVFLLVYQKCIRHMAAICGVAGSAWETEHLETPTYPPLKEKPGGAQRQLQLLHAAIADGNTEAGLAALEDLCTSGDEDELQEAVDAMEEAGLGTEAEDVLLGQLEAGAQVCKAWVALAAAHASLEDVADSIQGLPPDSLAQLDVTLAYASALADAGKAQLLRDWVQANEELLREDTQAWGQVGSYFSLVLDDEGTVEWMRDWQERDDADSWMLLYLTLSLRSLDRFDEGAEVNRHALDNLDPDHCSLFHQTWLAFDDALAGDADAVDEFFGEHQMSEFDPNHRWVAALAQAISRCLSAEEPANELDDIHSDLAQVAAELDPIDPDCVFEVAYRKAIKQIAKICGKSASAWKKAHLETPVMPKRKPKPGEVVETPA
jgi:hypothetical protein